MARDAGFEDIHIAAYASGALGHLGHLPTGIQRIQEAGMNSPCETAQAAPRSLTLAETDQNATQRGAPIRRVGAHDSLQFRRIEDRVRWSPRARWVLVSRYGIESRYMAYDPQRRRRFRISRSQNRTMSLAVETSSGAGGRPRACPLARRSAIPPLQCRPPHTASRTGRRPPCTTSWLANLNIVLTKFDPTTPNTHETRRIRPGIRASWIWRSPASFDSP